MSLAKVNCTEQVWLKVRVLAIMTETIERIPSRINSKKQGFVARFI